MVSPLFFIEWTHHFLVFSVKVGVKPPYEIALNNRAYP